MAVNDGTAVRHGRGLSVMSLVVARLWSLAFRQSARSVGQPLQRRHRVIDSVSRPPTTTASRRGLFPRRTLLPSSYGQFLVLGHDLIMAALSFVLAYVLRFGTL